MKKTITLATATAAFNLQKSGRTLRSVDAGNVAIVSSHEDIIKAQNNKLFLENIAFSKLIVKALDELELSKELLPKVREISEKKGFWNYFQILDLLKFNILPKRDGLRYIQVNSSIDEIILNNISIEEFGLGHIDADTIYWSSVDQYGREIEFNSNDGIYHKVVETVNSEEQVYLFPKTNLEKILAI